MQEKEARVKVVASSIVWVFFGGAVMGQMLVDSFPSPGGEPRGLAWDGAHLWCADAQTDSLYELEVSTGGVVSRFASLYAIQDEYGGITWGDDSTIWLANGSRVYQFNPVTGGIVCSFSCPGG